MIHLDGLHREILAGSWLVVRRRGYEELFTADEVDESARQGFGLTAKTTRVVVRGEHLVFFDDDVRDVVVYAQSEQLTMLERPIETPASRRGDRARPARGAAPARPPPRGHRHAGRRRRARRSSWRP